MIFNLDVLVLVVFLLINLVAGIYSGKGVSTIKEYAIGNRDFPTATLVATIVATWISASSMTVTVGETYTSGLYFIIPGLSDTIPFIIIALFIAPRMREFLGCLSVAEVMGKVYGNKARAITAIAGICPALGMIAAQFIITSALIQSITGISGIYASLVSALIVICYSTFGGIKSVTFTDMIQFVTFCVVIPTLGIAVFEHLSDTKVIVEYISNSPLYDFNEVFDISNPKFIKMLILFLFYSIPGLDSAIFQRITMARDSKQITIAFLIATGFCISIDSMLRFIAIAVAAKENLALTQNDLILYIINNYTPFYLKGVAVVGILAMMMSTADSYINSSSVLFSHDFCRSVGIKLSSKSELFLARITALTIGVFSLVVSVFFKNILDVLVVAYSFYMPVVSVPLLLAIFGFRTSKKAAMAAMFAGFATVVSCMLFSTLDGFIWGILANFVTIFVAHYLFNQPGGWGGGKDTKDLEEIREQRKEKWNKLINILENFKIMEFCRNNAPKQEKYYVYLGLYSVVLVFSSVYSLNQDLYTEYHGVLAALQSSVLVISTILLTYNLWRSGSRSKAFIILIWNLALIYSLVFTSCLLFFISKFSPDVFTITVISFITLAMLTRWHVFILMVCIGLFSSFYFYKFNYGIDGLTENISSNLGVLWAFLITSCLLTTLFKPKQEDQELAEQTLNYQNSKMLELENDIADTIKEKNEFLRNLNHETRTPVLGITTLGQALYESYDNLNVNQRKEALQEISSSATRLSSLVNNLIDLSQISSIDFKLHKENVNLSKLINERVKHCKKLYVTFENKEKLIFVLDIQDNINCNCNKYYITSVIDNIIINAIQFCEDGEITIALRKNKDGIEFKVADEGVGIPSDEVFNIFDAFTVSSRTRTKAGGRGIGLALCKKVIEELGGKIWAESDGVKGSVFKFIL